MGGRRCNGGCRGREMHRHHHEKRVRIIEKVCIITKHDKLREHMETVKRYFKTESGIEVAA